MLLSASDLPSWEVVVVTDENKDVTRRLKAALNAGEVDAASGLFAENFS